MKGGFDENDALGLNCCECGADHCRYFLGDQQRERRYDQRSDFEVRPPVFGDSVFVWGLDGPPALAAVRDAVEDDRQIPAMDTAKAAW